jgi:hypothetical protein
MKTAVAVVILTTSYLVKDEIQWQRTYLRRDFAGYLASWPPGRHRAAARLLLDEQLWNKATEEQTIESYERYSRLTGGQGRFKQTAAEEIEHRKWVDAVRVNTPESLQRYREAYPNSRFQAFTNDILAWMKVFPKNRALAGTKRVALHIDQTCQPPADTLDLLPFRKLAERDLATFGIKTVQRRDSDVGLVITASCTTSGGYYSISPTLAVGLESYRVTGASLAGTLGLELSGERLVTDRFAARLDPPKQIRSDDPPPLSVVFETSAVATKLLNLLSWGFGPAYLVLAMESNVAAVRSWAVDSLVAKGAASIEPLLGGLRRGHREASKGLVRLGPVVGQPLVSLLIRNDIAAPIHYQVQSTLADIKGDIVLNQLNAVLSHPDAEPRKRAAATLGQAADPSAVPMLVHALKDRESLVRAEAADALGSIADDRSIEPLGVLLSDAVPDVRAAAAKALGRMKGERITQLLVIASNDADPTVRDATVRGLASQADPRADEALRRLGPLVVRPLIDVLDTHGDPRYSNRPLAEHVKQLLREITGKPFAYDSEWLTWTERSR